MKESFLLHDGQDKYVFPGVIASAPLDTLQDVQRGVRHLRQTCDDEQQSDHDSGLGSGPSVPPDAIRCEFATPNWVPMGDWDGACYGIDLNPGPNGISGQVINFGCDQPSTKYVLALSWAQFLEDIVDELEAGNLVPTRGSEGTVEFFGRPGKEENFLFNFYKEWN